MRQRFMIFGAPASVLMLILANSVVELTLVASDPHFSGTSRLRILAYDTGAFWAPLLHGMRPIFPAQPFTMFITYAFLHAGLLHLTVNMIALFSFGEAIVRRIGQKRFLLAYFVSVLGGAIGFGLLSNSQSPMVGASGALFGLLGVWISWDYLDRRHHGEPLWAIARTLVFLVLYNLVFWFMLSGQLAWETHLGGFVAGWLLALYWGRGPDVYLQSRKRRLGSNRPARRGPQR